MMLKTTITVLALLAMTARAPGQMPPAPPPPVKALAMERLKGVWIEGPGYDVGYGGSFEACAQKCLVTARCVMIEYYRPEKKCNLYDAARPRQKGGSSDVAVKR